MATRAQVVPKCGTAMIVGKSANNPAAPLSGDTGAHPPPAYTSFEPPQLPGSTYVDPQFGCTVTRVTNARSHDAGSDHQLHHYYMASALNQSNDRLIIGDNNGGVYIVDRSSRLMVSEKALTGYTPRAPGAALYWGRRPGETNTLYWKASDGTHEVIRKADTTACSAARPCSSLSATTVYKSECPAGNFNAGNEDDLRWNSTTGIEYLGWDCGPDVGLVNLNAGLLGPTATLASNFDNYKLVRGPGAEMYLCVNFGTSGAGPTQGVWCYDHNMKTVTQVVRSPQHGNTVWDPATDTAYWVEEQNGNEASYGGLVACTHPPTETGWAAISIATKPTCSCLLTYPVVAGNTCWCAQSHLSGGDYGLAAMEIYYLYGNAPKILDVNQTLDPNYEKDWGYLIGEIVLMGVSNHTIYRLAHHRSRPNTTALQDYWAVPKASLSIDNNYIVFDSNMTQIGSPLAPYVLGFTDVYMVGPLRGEK